MYIAKISFLHKAHPLSKLISLSLIFLFSLLTKDIIILTYNLLLIIFIGIIAKCWTNFKKALIFGLVIILFSALLWIIFYPYKTSIEEKIRYGLMMGLRLNNVFLSGILFLSTTQIEEFIYALRKIKIPYRICFSISLAFRLIPLIYETSSIVIASQIIKGLDLKRGSPFRRIKNYAPLLSPIISYILRQANYITIAVEARAFSIKREKTEYLAFNFGVKDFLIIFYPIIFFLFSAKINIKIIL